MNMERDISYLPVLFHSFNKQMMEEHEKILANSELTRRHIPFLIMLSRFPEGLTQQELSEKLNLDKAHTSRTLRDLEAKGYVEKLGETAYKNKFKETKKAHKVKCLVEKKNQEIIKKILGILSNEELDTFEMLVKKITASVR